MASKIYKQIESQVLKHNDIMNVLGLNVYNGLLAKQATITTTRQVGEKPSSTPIVHNDDSVEDKFGNYNGVYYVNYPNIYNTLNRNIGGSSYMAQNYDILLEGNNLGQREGIVFEASNRPTPMFISDKERDSYIHYVNYVTDVFGEPTLKDTSSIEESKSGYGVGVQRGFEMGGLSNPNKDNDTLLGKVSSAIFTNILFARNIRRQQRGFPSITDIGYYGKGRIDIEENPNILSLDTAIGISSVDNKPEFGIKSDYAFIGFGNSTLDYSYSSTTDVNYTLFDRWGELSNGTISLSNSPAYKSIKKSVTVDTDGGELYMSANPTIDMSQYLIQNLMYKGGFNGSGSFSTYFAKHNFNALIEDIELNNRYYIKTNGFDESVGDHVDYHYDEGRLNQDYASANAGTNHHTYLVSDGVGGFGKDLLEVTDKAFRNAKYDTIISKFATQHNGKYDDKYSRTQSAVSSRFGMSHGRNLLKVERDGDRNVIGVDTSGGNGYDNPYCRVWTYHHQYHNLCDTIRPFTVYDESGNKCDFDNTYNYRTAKQIAKNRHTIVKKLNKGIFYDRNSNDLDMIYSEGQDELVEYGVLNNKNGLVNITPTIADDGTDGNSITRCMFSIENLAWKDIFKDKDCGYRNLSSGQTGPNGGRIMWFPPYGLTFNESVSSSWNPVSFIGRGENIYTYSNTERGGNLSFLLLIDHPSVVEEWKRNKDEFNDYTSDVDGIKSAEQRILRFFAGCELLDPLTRKKDVDCKDVPGMIGPDCPEEKPEVVLDPPVEEPPLPEPEPEPEPRKGSFSFAIYYPNNYSGVNDKPEEAVSYLLNGVLFGEDVDGYYKLGYDILDYQYSLSDRDSFEGGYEMNRDKEYGVSTPLYATSGAGGLFYDRIEDNVPYKLTTNFYVKDGSKRKSRPYVYSTDKIQVSGLSDVKFFSPWCGQKWGKMPKYQSSWGYRVDDRTFHQKLRVVNGSTKYNNYTDCMSYIGTSIYKQLGLNSTNGYLDEKVKEHFGSIIDNTTAFYSFADVFVALMPDYEKAPCFNGKINMVKVNEIRDALQFGITKVSVSGCASIQGNWKGIEVNNRPTESINTANDNLSKQRGQTVLNWLRSTKAFKDIEDNIEWDDITIIERPVPNNAGGTDAPDMKVTRCAFVTVYYDETSLESVSESQSIEYLDEDTQLTSRSGDPYAENNMGEEINKELAEIEVKPQLQTIRYDNEETFFKDLATTDPFLHHRITDKIKYFDPAYHSITPEGFASRLTFLHQCTRQSNTIGASDTTSKTASNLAFGRPPVCVLRIGDFYNTRIIIESLNISYESGSGIQWDMNPEGIGVMPMYAKIDISFKFIGGSDLKGPINRLQNAVSFNYYANTSVYDNRSDYYADDERKIIKPWEPDTV